jgi:hypothetical protein
LHNARLHDAQLHNAQSHNAQLHNTDMHATQPPSASGAAGAAPAAARVSVAAPRGLWADALTKIVAASGDTRHPLLARLGACAWLH